MLSGQGAIPLLAARASRWPRALWRGWTAPASNRVPTTRRGARQEGCSSVSSQKGAVTRMP